MEIDNSQSFNIYANVSLTNSNTNPPTEIVN